MRRLKLALQIIGGIVVVGVLILVGTTLLLNTNTVQDKVVDWSVDALKERLGTQVQVDSARVNLFNQKVELYGVGIEDQKQRKMLQIEKLSARAELMSLRHDEVKISDVSIKGCQALIVKNDSDLLPNYQFIIDSLKQKVAESVQPADKPKKKMKVDIDNISIDDVSVTYNGNLYHLGRLEYQQKADGTSVAEIRDVEVQWEALKKKGKVDNLAQVYRVLYYEKDGLRSVKLDSLRFRTDNHLPRKNHNKPKRGFFDVGHLDITAHLQIDISHADKDSVVAIVKGTARDTLTGIDLRNLSMRVCGNKQQVHLSDVMIQQGWTVLKFADADVQLPSKKEGRELRYATSTIFGYVVLQDIARPFAPVLSNFTLPLELMVKMQGDENSIKFSDVDINNSDSRLRILASGYITDLKDAHNLKVHFDVSHMFARGNSKENIIRQFPVKRLMMKQFHALGDISYVGQFDVLWKKEQFAGQLHTQVGDLDFMFTIDNADKYVFGAATTGNISVDKTFDMPNIGVASCQATFKVDISKPRTALMRQQLGGKLPIGVASIQVKEGQYKKIKIHDIAVDVNSNGAVAEGELKTHGHHIDLSCNFSFTSTDEMKKMKISHPGIKIHKLTPEDHQQKAEEKQRKKEEKETRKQQKQLEKEARKQERQQQ